VKKALYLVAVFGLLLTTACGTPKLKNGEDAVAKIDGKEYSANDLYESLKKQYGYSTIMNMIDSEIANKEVETDDEIKAYADEAMDYYTNTASQFGMTLVQFAQTYLNMGNVTTEDEIKEYIISDRKLSVAIERKVAEKISDEEIEKYYNENYKTTYTYRDFLVVTEKTDDKIKEIKKKLKDKKKDDLVDEYKKIAKNEKYSQGESKEYTNTTKNNVEEEIWKKLKDMDDYEYTTVKTESGTHFILKIKKGKSQDLDEVKDEIKTQLAQEKLQSDNLLSYEMLTELRNKYKLAFFDEDLKASYDDFLKQLEDAKKQASNSNK
jgi:hypothetical protein